MSWFTDDLEIFNLEPSSNVLSVLFKPNKASYTGYAKLYYHNVPHTKFIPLVGIDQTGELISNSNSFLVDSNFCNNSFTEIKKYDDIHKIFSGIEIVKRRIPQLPVFKSVQEPMFLLCNPFSGRNAGHDLSILFNRIAIYRSMCTGTSMPVVLSESMQDFPLTMDICKVLLPDIEIYILKPETVVEFKNLVITENVVFDINRHRSMHREVIDFYTRDPSSVVLNRKVCLIKNTAVNKNIVSSWSAFYSVELMEQLQDKYGYVVINPENIDTRTLVCLLYYAQKILVSYGGIMYVNQIFFNPSAELIYVDRSGQRPYFDAHRYKTVTPDNNNLDLNIRGFIQIIGENE